METPQPWSRNKNSSLLLNSQRVCYLFTKIFSTVTCLLSSESPQLAVLYPCSVVVSCCHSDDSLPHSHYHPVASSLFSVTFPLPPPPTPAALSASQMHHHRETTELRHRWHWDRKRSSCPWAEPWSHWSRAGGNPFPHLTFFFVFFFLFSYAKVCCFLCLEQTCSISLRHS